MDPGLDELGALLSEIDRRQRYIEGQQILIEVLERDGHDVREQEAALEQERAKLALEVARKLQLQQSAIK